jgi:hypothetical protein
MRGPMPGWVDSGSGRIYPPAMNRVLLLLVAIGLPVLSACASAPPTRSVGMAGVAPMLSVERFLQASNARDLDAMARIFGTERGALAERTGNPLSCGFRRVGSWVGLSRSCVSWQEIEIRMNTIAVILAHDDFQVRSEATVPGRTSPTTRIGVDLVQRGETVTDVPFVVVRAGDGRWLVEEIGLDRAMSGR